MRRLLLLFLWLSAGIHGYARADVAALIVRAKPSVLLVGAYAETDSPRFTFSGSGFAVAGGNHLITNAHVLNVLAGDRQLTVQVRQGDGSWSPRKARVVTLDRAHDLALLAFDGPAALPLKVSADGPAKEGTPIILMGFPIGGALGFSTVTHKGMVSAVTAIALPPPTAQSLSLRAIRQLREGTFDILQLDATAYPGNSGGPVLDQETGDVVGIVNATFVKGGREGALSHPSGISYAIPSQYAARLIAELPAR